MYNFLEYVKLKVAPISSENLHKNGDQNVKLLARVHHFKPRFQNFPMGCGGFPEISVDFQAFLSFLIGSPGFIKQCGLLLRSSVSRCVVCSWKICLRCVWFVIGSSVSRYVVLYWG